MIDLGLPAALAALLVGIGSYGILARRNAVLVLIGVELVLNGANLLLVTAGSRPGSPFAAGPVLTLFVITIAAAEIVVALAVILLMFRRVDHIDLTIPGSRYSADAGARGIPRSSGAPEDAEVRTP